MPRDPQRWRLWVFQVELEMSSEEEFDPRLERMGGSLEAEGKEEGRKRGVVLIPCRGNCMCKAWMTKR